MADDEAGIHDGGGLRRCLEQELNQRSCSSRISIGEIQFAADPSRPGPPGMACRHQTGCRRSHRVADPQGSHDTRGFRQPRRGVHADLRLVRPGTANGPGGSHRGNLPDRTPDNQHLEINLGRASRWRHERAAGLTLGYRMIVPIDGTRARAKMPPVEAGLDRNQPGKRPAIRKQVHRTPLPEL